MFILLRDLVVLSIDSSRLLMTGVSSILGRTLYSYRLLGLISAESTDELILCFFFLALFLTLAGLELPVLFCCIYITSCPLRAISWLRSNISFFKSDSLAIPDMLLPRTSYLISGRILAWLPSVSKMTFPRFL